jgi:hypothetical protein
MGCVLYPVELLGLADGNGFEPLFPPSCGGVLPLNYPSLKWLSGKDFNPLLHVRPDALSGELAEIKSMAEITPFIIVF